MSAEHRFERQRTADRRGGPARCRSARRTRWRVFSTSWVTRSAPRPASFSVFGAFGTGASATSSAISIYGSLCAVCERACLARPFATRPTATAARRRELERFGRIRIPAQRHPQNADVELPRGESALLEQLLLRPVDIALQRIGKRQIRFAPATISRLEASARSTGLLRRRDRYPPAATE